MIGRKGKGLHRCWVLWGLCVMAVVSAWGQKRHVSFSHLTIYDGLSQSSITAMVQDQQGFVWLGTQHGLNRYDGNSFRVFHHLRKDETSLSNDYIAALTLDEQGILWVLTQDMVLHRYDELSERFQRIRLLEQDVSAPLFMAVTADLRGHIWAIGTDLGAFRVDRQSHEVTQFIKTEASETIPNNRTTDILRDHRGVIWVTSHRGLARFDEERQIFTSFQHPHDHLDTIGHNAMSTLTEDSQGRLWLSTYEGLDMLDKDRRTWVQMFEAPFEKIGGPVFSLTLLADKRGLWLGSSQGLYFLDTVTGKIDHLVNEPGTPDSLSNDMVLSLMQDHADTVWIGTLNGGNLIDRGGSHFDHFKREVNESYTLGSNMIWSMFKDRDGHLWVSHEKGIDRFVREKRSVTHYSHDDLGTSGNVPYYRIKQFSDGSIWATGSGVSYFRGDPKGMRHFRSNQRNPKSLSSNSATDVLEDRNNTIWVATQTGLNKLVDLESGSFEQIVHDPEDPTSLHSNHLSTLLEDRQGYLWIGSFEGVSRFDPERKAFSHFLQDPDDPQSISEGEIFSFLEDSLGRIWIGTMGGGLNLWEGEGKGFRHIRVEDGLPNNVINGVLEDDRGFLWVASNGGLSRLDPKSFQIVNYDVHNGLQSNEFNNGVCFKAEDTGELFFGGINGFNAFFPENIKANPTPPVVQLTQLRIFNQEVVPGEGEDATLTRPIHLTDHLEIGYQQGVFTLEMAALHYAHTEGNQYAYMLEGLHRDWVHVPAQRRFASFTNLSPNTYKLKLKAANSDGIWSEVVEPLAITVQPPPWRTWWAYLGYVLLILLAIYYYNHIQQAKLEREKAHNDRLRQLDRLKDEFLANTSHELRTPLNGIIGIAESLLVGAAGEVNGKLAKNLSMVVASGKRLSNLVNDLLDFSKMKSSGLRLVRKPVDISAIVDMTFVLTEPLLGSKTLRLINTLSDEVPMVDGDEDRIQQILLNLVGNAVKFSEAGHVKVCAEVDGDWLALSVEDTGMGIPPEQFERIFESFEQVDGSSSRLAGGTGLGLAITRQLVELHGGEITVSSEIGTGSTFTVTLPVAGSGAIRVPKETVPVVSQPVREEAPLKPLPVVTNAEGQFRILVVDDEAVNRQVLVNHLTLQNYAIMEASNGKDALAMVDKEVFDLVLLDIMMPNMNGYEVCRKIREVHAIQDLPVIFLTAKNQPTDLSSGFASGGSDYLAKPISRDELLSRVRTHLTLLDVHRNLENRVEERTRELKVAYKTLEDMSLTDPLTGLRNRRFVLKHIDSDVAQTNRAYLDWIENGQSKPAPRESDLLFFLIDMDHFKSVNDTYGHAAGDEMLLQIRSLLEKAFRSSDFLVRWGGEEFLVVARFTSREAAPGMAERLRTLIADHAFDIGGGQRLHRTCSIGFAAYPFIETQPRLASWSQVVDIADLGLYAAKYTSRNAYVGVCSTDQTEKNDMMRRLLADPAMEHAHKHIKVFTSIPNDKEIVWKRPKT